jgi:hypothetical protein
MKAKLSFFIMAAVCGMVPSAWSQNGTIVAGAGVVYNLPVGSLQYRFNGSPGVMIFAGQEVSSNWTWVGKLEYFELTKVNESKLTKTVNIQEGTATNQYQVKLNKLSMKLKAAGLTAEAILNLARFSPIEAKAHVGFGFYNWDSFRSKYNDSLFARSVVSGNLIKVADLAVPENRQTDWSGSLNLGCDLNVNLIDPVWITLGADYKLIIGELWQTLDLDLENVSGIQLLSFRAGVRISF